MDSPESSLPASTSDAFDTATFQVHSLALLFVPGIRCLIGLHYEFVALWVLNLD